MSRPPDPKKKIVIRPPNGATHWSCWRVISANAAIGERGRREKCTSEPGDDGKVPDAWPVQDFSTARVLEQWGDGKYRVDWYDAQGERLKEHGELFDVATPRRGRPPNGPRLRPQAPGAREGDDRSPVQQAAAAIAGGGGQIGIVELLTLLKSEREDAREREQLASERNMQFMIQQQQQSTALLTALLQGKGTSTGELDMMRRELSQTVREEMFRLRQQVLTQPDPEDDDPEDDDPDAPPADMTEAGERIAMRFMREIEGMAPEALPKVIDFINRKISGATNGANPNGRANGS